MGPWWDLAITVLGFLKNQTTKSASRWFYWKWLGFNYGAKPFSLVMLEKVEIYSKDDGKQKELDWLAHLNSWTSSSKVHTVARLARDATRVDQNFWRVQPIKWPESHCSPMQREMDELNRSKYKSRKVHSLGGHPHSWTLSLVQDVWAA